MNLKILFMIIFLPTFLLSHSGRTNKEGCHNNRKTGGYHCHNQTEYFKKKPNNDYKRNKPIQDYKQSKYDQTLFLDCDLDREISTMTNPIFKKEDLEIKEKQIFCFNEEMKYFNFDKCDLNSPVKGQSYLSVLYDEINESRTVSKSLVKTRIHRYTGDIEIITLVKNDLGENLGLIKKYGKCKKRRLERKF